MSTTTPKRTSSADIRQGESVSLSDVGSVTFVSCNPDNLFINFDGNRITLGQTLKFNPPYPAGSFFTLVVNGNTDEHLCIELTESGDLKIAAGRSASGWVQLTDNMFRYGLEGEPVFEAYLKLMDSVSPKTNYEEIILVGTVPIGDE